MEKEENPVPRRKEQWDLLKDSESNLKMDKEGWQES